MRKLIPAEQFQPFEYAGLDFVGGALAFGESN